MHNSAVKQRRNLTIWQPNDIAQNLFHVHTWNGHRFRDLARMPQEIQWRSEYKEIAQTRAGCLRKNRVFRREIIIVRQGPIEVLKQRPCQTLLVQNASVILNPSTR